MPSSVLLTWDAHRRRDLEPAQRPMFGLVQGSFQVCIQPPHDGICNSAKVPQVHGLRRTCISPSSNPDPQPSLEEDAMLAKMGWFEWSMIGVVVLGAIAAVFVVTNQL